MREASLNELVENIEALADDILNQALNPGGPCIKSDIISNMDDILEICSIIRKKL